MGSVTVQQQNGLGEGKIGEDGYKVFGGQLKQDFLFASGWRNLNHGELSHTMTFNCYNKN